jgi:hypothetical protein
MTRGDIVVMAVCWALLLLGPLMVVVVMVP